MFITTSSYSFFPSSSPRINTDAMFSLSLLKKKPRAEDYKFNIDAKRISGEAIISADEYWLDGKTKENHSEEIKKSIEQKTVKIPFYTGFQSGKDDSYASWFEKKEYDEPKFFHRSY